MTDVQTIKKRLRYEGKFEWICRNESERQELLTKLNIRERTRVTLKVDGEAWNLRKRAELQAELVQIKDRVFEKALSLHASPMDPDRQAALLSEAQFGLLLKQAIKELG